MLFDNCTIIFRRQTFKRGFSYQRIWSRGVIIVGVLVYVWFTSKDGREVALAKQKQVIPHRGQSVECDQEFLDEVMNFAGCIPEKCGRYVSDKLVTASEANTLLKIAKRGKIITLFDICTLL